MELESLILQCLLSFKINLTLSKLIHGIIILLLQLLDLGLILALSEGIHLLQMGLARLIQSKQDDTSLLNVVVVQLFQLHVVEDVVAVPENLHVRLWLRLLVLDEALEPITPLL